MSQTRFLQFLRSNLLGSKEAAIQAVKGQVGNSMDGSMVLGRYEDTNGDVRSVIGIVGKNLSGANNSMTIFDLDKVASDALIAKVDNIEDTLGIGEGASGVTIISRIESAEALLAKLDGTVTEEGSIKKQIKDAVDAEATIARAAEQANATAIADEKSRAETAEQALQGKIDDEATAREEEDSKLSDAIADEKSRAEGQEAAIRSEFASADDDLKEELIGDAESYKTLGALEDAIQSAVADAKSYSISKLSNAEVTALGDSKVQEAYKLVDEDNTTVGDVIKIYKDSSLKSVALNGQILNFTYILADGSESTVGVDVSNFLAESEFSNGLQVIDHVVSVKVDETSETFLTVGPNGIKLSGVQNAINTLDTDLQNQIDIINNTTIPTLNAEYKAADETLQANINTEKSERTAADSGLDTRIKVLEDAVGGDSVETQITEAIDDLKGTPEGKTLNESYDTIYEIAEELAKLEGDENKEGSIAYDIKAKVDSLDSTKTGNGAFVDVTVTQVDGVITEVSVAESDIASAEGLSDEIDRAKAAEQANTTAISSEKTRAEGQEAAIRTEFANADTALKNNLLGDAAESYNTLGKLEDAIQAVDAKVIALDVIDSEVIGSYVTSVSQEDGKISSEKKTLVSSTNDNVITFDNVNNGIYLSNVWDCGTFENN